MCWSRNKEENITRLRLEKEQGPVYTGPVGHIPDKQTPGSGRVRDTLSLDFSSTFNSAFHTVNRIGKCKQRFGKFLNYLQKILIDLHKLEKVV